MLLSRILLTNNIRGTTWPAASCPLFKTLYETMNLPKVLVILFGGVAVLGWIIAAFGNREIGFFGILIFVFGWMGVVGIACIPALSSNSSIELKAQLGVYGAIGFRLLFLDFFYWGCLEGLQLDLVLEPLF